MIEADSSIANVPKKECCVFVAVQLKVQFQFEGPKSYDSNEKKKIRFKNGFTFH